MLRYGNGLPIKATVCKIVLVFIMPAILRGVLLGVWALDFCTLGRLWDYNGKRAQRELCIGTGTG